MTRKGIVVALIFLLLGTALVLPEEQADVRAVIEQHLVWPAEDPSVSGLDANGVLSSHLPIVIIHADGAEIPGTDPQDTADLLCDYSIIFDPDGRNRSDDIPDQHGSMAISVRGNSSRIFVKKQYGMKLLDAAGMSEDAALLDLPAESNWVLNGSYIDHSMIRNYLMYNLCAKMKTGYVPRCRMCEVMVTDAAGIPRYQGVYTLIEKIKVSEERLNLTEYDPRYPQSSFLVQMNSHTDKLQINHLKPDSIRAYPLDLEYPDVEDVTPESLHYIESRLLEFEKALYDATFTGDWTDVESLIDIDSFVDYYLINEFFQNYDAGTRSTYFYADLGGRIHIGPVWDFDGTFNNFALMDLDSNLMEMKYSMFFSYLVQSPGFMQKCVLRYGELRGGLFSDEALIRSIDETAAYLGSAAVRNADRWYQDGGESFRTDIRKMKEFVVTRGGWMDEAFEHFSGIVY